MRKTQLWIAGLAVFLCASAPAVAYDGIAHDEIGCIYGLTKTDLIVYDCLVYNVDVYAISYGYPFISTGYWFYSPSYDYHKLIVFESKSVYSYSMEGMINWNTPRCILVNWCNSKGKAGQTYLNLH